MSTPAINVNLKPCSCAFRDPDMRADDHPYPCMGAPLRIPCPIPRSVTFSVALGECRRIIGALTSCGKGTHHRDCPALPVRVSCSISGETWEASALRDDDGEPGALRVRRDLMDVCRERWTLVKALVLGHAWSEHAPESWDAFSPRALFSQRDAVYAALADMARAEEAHYIASAALFDVLKGADPQRRHVTGPAGYAMGWHDPSDKDACLNSRAGLSAFVEMLIEQVGGDS